MPCPKCRNTGIVYQNRHQQGRTLCDCREGNYLAKRERAGAMTNHSLQIAFDRATDAGDWDMCDALDYVARKRRLPVNWLYFESAGDD